MKPDDVTYAALLLSSLAAGHVIIKQCPNSSRRKFVGSLFGFILALLSCKQHVIHSLITVVGNYTIIRIFSRRICHIVSFIWCFAYLSFFRGHEYIGLSKPPAFANGIQLILTLKMVGAAFELHDSHANKNALAKLQGDKSSGDNNISEKRQEIELKVQHQNVNPSLYDLLCYSYCYIGLFTGPYFKLRTYEDMINMDIETITHRIGRLQSSWQRFQRVPVYVILYLTISHYYYIEYAESEEFFSRTFAYRLWFMVPMFVVFRLRVYIAWSLSECCCMLSGLGAYPVGSRPRPGQGPSRLDALRHTPGGTAAGEAASAAGVSETDDDVGVRYNFECIHNIDERGCELSSSVREGMRCWNMSVQFWLATYIYRRVPVRAVRTSVTMLVSAYWHGIHPGYYLSFLTIPLCLLAEDKMREAFRTESNSKRYDLLAAFTKMRVFDYCAMGFLLLGGASTLNYWRSIGYLIHVLAIIFYVTAYAYLKLSNTNTKTGKKPTAATHNNEKTE